MVNITEQVISDLELLEDEAIGDEKSQALFSLTIALLKQYQKLQGDLYWDVTLTPIVGEKKEEYKN
jgi:hypothetical protein